MEYQESSERAEFTEPATAAVVQTDTSPPRGNPFPIVGVGASAGGLEAFGQLLEAIPSETGMAIVFVQHLDPAHDSLLTELLGHRTLLPVVTVSDGITIEPDHVYVIPPNMSMELHDGTLKLAQREPGLHLPIDIFFKSLARVQGSRAIGVVLSGNASDGSLGLRAIKAECGLTFAQDEASARFAGMPRNAAATGAVDYILPPADIARELALLAHHPYLVPSVPGDAESETLPEGDGELKRILTLLYGSSKVDFSRYKPTTVRRRIGRRMMVLRTETLREYARYLEQHPEELRELYRDLLISVTSFFRDPEAFAALGRLMVSMVRSSSERDPSLVRVWVPGCATGEEVYSIAIALFEVLQSEHLAATLQLFGTDISDMALEKARNGVYPMAIAEDVSEERLARFFSRIDHGYQINKSIRESIIFARHDVTRDPPFGHLDLVSCRNLLIYLDQSAQRHVLPTFHYSLKPTGLLMLGSAESTAAAPDLFTPVDKQNRIYGRKSGPARITALETPMFQAREARHANGGGPPAQSADVLKKLERLIQSRYSPDAVFVNADLDVLQFRGQTSRYLEHACGQASLNLLRMAKESLLLPLRRAVRDAGGNGYFARQAGVVEDTAGQVEEIAIEVTVVPGGTDEERHFLIVFTREAPASAKQESAVPPATLPAVDDDVAKLQRDLAETRGYLRNLTEEYEAHAEELRAANEESRSANEELQSTNEELGTTKEQLQSSNEELTTVNEELQSRNQELHAINSDLKNLLAAVTLPIIMVDADLRVRRFNPAAGRLLALGPLDIGRPVGHIRGQIETPRLEQQIRNVIETLQPLSEETQDANGCWYLLNIRPYRTMDDHIAGAVVTFQDIDPLKRGLQAAETARDYAESMIETVREPLVVLDNDLRVQRATAAFYEMFLVSREETEGRFLYDLGSGQWNQPRLRELLGTALFRGEPFHDYETEHEFPHIGRRVMRLNGRRIALENVQTRRLLLSIEDGTERREVAEIRFRRLFETAKDGIVVIDDETEVLTEVNPFFLELSGFAREELVGSSLRTASSTLRLPALEDIVSETRVQEIVRYDDLLLLAKDGRPVSIEVVANRYRVGGQMVAQLNIRDISARKEAMRALRESEEQFRLFMESVSDYALFQLDPNGLILTWNTGAERLLGWSEREAVGQPFDFIFTPEDKASGAPQQALERGRRHGRSEAERQHPRKDGQCRVFNCVLTQVCDEQGRLLGFAKVMQDITIRKAQQEQLTQSLEEKSMLVREIHHRVKNNLQVIVSLLSLQSNHMKDPGLVAAFEETEGRVRAIAQIHERLYASDDLAEVEFGSYLTSLAKQLLLLHATAPDQIALDLEVTNLVLRIDQAIPLGLVANELVVNSLKHGLRGGTGRLQIRLTEIRKPAIDEGGQGGERRWAQVRIADSGPGLPPGMDVAKTKSMGYQLVYLLLRQLHGQLRIGSGPGLDVTVEFPVRSR